VCDVAENCTGSGPSCPRGCVRAVEHGPARRPTCDVESCTGSTGVSGRQRGRSARALPASVDVCDATTARVTAASNKNGHHPRRPYPCDGHT
jgi:hypothetical protein